jgi:hypothetical protein
MLEATETRLQHTSKFLADLSSQRFPDGKYKSTTSKEAHSNMLISDMPGQRYLRLPHTSTRQSSLSMLRQTRILMGLSHEIFYVYSGWNGFILALIGTAPGFSILKMLLEF